MRPLRQDINHKEVRTLNTSKRAAMSLPLPQTIQTAIRRETEPRKRREFTGTRTSQCINQRVPKAVKIKAMLKEARENRMDSSTSRKAPNRITISKVKSRIKNTAIGPTIINQTVIGKNMVKTSSRIKIS